MYGAINTDYDIKKRNFETKKVILIRGEIRGKAKKRYINGKPISFGFVLRLESYNNMWKYIN